MIRRFRIWLAEILAEDYITDWHYSGVKLGRKMEQKDLLRRLEDAGGYPV